MNKSFAVRLLFFLLLSLTISCLSPSQQGEKASFFDYTDCYGNRVKLDSVPARIISLSPAITEMVFMLDDGNKLVGISDFCHYPEATDTMHRVGGMQNINVESLVTLNPDVVLIGSIVTKQDMEKMERAGLKVVVVITLSQLNDNSFMIEHQAEVIELDNVTITSSGNFAKLNRYDLLQNGVTAPALYPYFQDVDYLTLPIPTGVEQTILGVNFATSKIGSSNFDYRYYIVPRFVSDMSAMTSVPDYGKMQISVYPNPTVDVVRWNNCDATSAEIYDINGKKVAEQSVQNDNMVSLRGLSTGSYFLRLLNDNEVVGTAKIVKR